jgi:hypothetical protein
MLERSFFQFQNHAAIPGLYESEYLVVWVMHEWVLCRLWVTVADSCYVCMRENNAWTVCHVWV